MPDESGKNDLHLSDRGRMSTSKGVDDADSKHSFLKFRGCTQHKWQQHADRRKPMGPQGTGPADSMAPGMLSASLAPSSHIGTPHIDTPGTLAEALPMVDDEALSSVVLPPPPLAPPEVVAAEICTNGGDTHFLEGTVEQVVVLIDDLDDCAQGDNNEMADAGLQLTGDHQECSAMPKSEDVDITETPTLATPEELIAEALQTAEALEGSLAYVLADSKQHPGATSTATSPVADATSAARSH